MPLPTYTKPFLDVRAQIALMESRGLTIDIARQQAEDYLSSVNYYRFTGYALPFLVDRTTFKPNAKFSEVLAVYEYDRKLRDLLGEALEVVELTFRAILARHFSCAHGPLGWLDSANFRNASDHARLLANLRGDYNQSQTRCARHLRANYQEPPLWALVEVVTFGRLSYFFSGMLQTDQKAVAAEYGIVNPRYLKSYLQHLCVLRNLCAHHGRIYDLPWGQNDDNRHPYSFPELLAWTALRKNGSVSLGAQRTLFEQFALVYHFAGITKSAAFDRDEWRVRVVEAMNATPSVSVVNLKSILGIPADPLTSPLWV